MFLSGTLSKQPYKDVFPPLLFLTVICLEQISGYKKLLNFTVSFLVAVKGRKRGWLISVSGVKIYTLLLIKFLACSQQDPVGITVFMCRV